MATVDDRLSALEKSIAKILRALKIEDSDKDGASALASARAKHFASAGVQDPDEMIARAMGIEPATPQAATRGQGGHSTTYQPVSQEAARQRLAELEGRSGR